MKVKITSHSKRFSKKPKKIDPDGTRTRNLLWRILIHMLLQVAQCNLLPNQIVEITRFPSGKQRLTIRPPGHNLERIPYFSIFNHWQNQRELFPFWEQIRNRRYETWLIRCLSTRPCLLWTHVAELYNPISNKIWESLQMILVNRIVCLAMRSTWSRCRFYSKRSQWRFSSSFEALCGSYLGSATSNHR